MKSGVKNISQNSLLVFSAFFFIAFILILLAGFRPSGFDPDYYNYLETLTLDVKDFSFFSMKPLYWALVYFNKLLFNANPNSFFLIVATIYVSVSMYAIKKYSVNIFLSLILFLFLFFPDFGLIQIRNGMAIEQYFGWRYMI